MVNPINPSPQRPPLLEKQTAPSRSPKMTPHQNLTQDENHLRQLMDNPKPREDDVSRRQDRQDSPKQKEREDSSKPKEQEDSRSSSKEKAAKKPDPQNSSDRLDKFSLKSDHPHHKEMLKRSDHPVTEVLKDSSMLTPPSIQPSSTPAETAPLAPAALPEGISQVAERILVSTPQTQSGTEVRIKVDSHLLPNTEIRLTERAGILTVQMNTASPLAHNLLGAEQAHLSQFLSRQSSLTVNVELNYTGHQEENNPQQRSRGLDLFNEDGESS